MINKLFFLFWFFLSVIVAKFFPSSLPCGRERKMLLRFKLDRILEFVLKYSPPFLKIAGKSMGWGSTCRYEVRPFMPPLTGVIEPKTKIVLDLVKLSKLCSIPQRIQACAMRFHKMQIGKIWCMLIKHLEWKSISQEKYGNQSLRKLRRRRFEILRKFIRIWKILKNWESRENGKNSEKRWIFEKENIYQEALTLRIFLGKRLKFIRKLLEERNSKLRKLKSWEYCFWNIWKSTLILEKDEEFLWKMNFKK